MLLISFFLSEIFKATVYFCIFSVVSIDNFEYENYENKITLVLKTQD